MLCEKHSCIPFPNYRNLQLTSSVLCSSLKNLIRSENIYLLSWIVTIIVMIDKFFLKIFLKPAESKPIKAEQMNINWHKFKFNVLKLIWLISIFNGKGTITVKSEPVIFLYKLTWQFSFVRIYQSQAAD